MSESGLCPVQTWLWSELDNLGIDGVIYSRHILDLLISSKHTMDYLLAKKEQNIFSKIAPSGKRSKHKYSRRSSSFSACEEILWKKEIAVTCLLSAVDANSNSGDTANSIQGVVDELYVKLASLHLTPDVKKAKSDDDCTSNRNDVETFLRPKKENYEDAFPSLDGSKASPPEKSRVQKTIWHRSSVEKEAKSDYDSDNIHNGKTKLKSARRLSHHDINTFSATAKSNTKPRQVLRFPKCVSDNGNHVHEKENEYDAGAFSSQPPLAVNHPSTPAKQMRPSKKQKSLRRVHHGWYAVQDTGPGQPRRFQRSRTSQNGRFYRRNAGRDFAKVRNDSSKRNNRLAKSVLRNQSKKFAEVNAGMKITNRKREMSKISKVTSDLPQEYCTHADVEPSSETWNEQDYAHLPSWMETSLSNITYPYEWLNSPGKWGLTRNDSGQFDEPPAEISQEMAFSSKWFRDPETGLLTFQPSNISKESLSSSGVASRHSSSSSDAEEELCQEFDRKIRPGASESWMWCPSPSLWEDGKTSPISRLHSVYKRGILAFNNSEEDYVDDISSRIWEEYKTIFLDLQEMEGIDQEDKDSDDVFETQKNDSDLPPHIHLGSEDVRASVESCSQPSNSGESILDNVPEPQSEQDQQNHSLLHSSSANSVASSLVETPPADVQTGATITSGVASEVWKYTPLSDSWSSGDNTTEGQKVGNEISNLLEWALGQPSDVWRLDEEPLKPSQDLLKQDEVWGGGGDMLSSWKPSSDPMKPGTGGVMNYDLVDAMFSDLHYQVGLDVGEDVLDYLGVVQPKRSEGGTLSTPESWPNPPGVADLLDPECSYQLFSVDISSLYLHSPLSTFPPRPSDPWPTKLRVDELFSGRPITSIPNLDNFLASIASADRSETVGQGFNWLTSQAGAEKQKQTFLESVTENDAWKTSLRIGNIWQNISGIRPVNVIYSENKLEPEGRLIPSSETHFRPISTPVDQDPPHLINDSSANQEISADPVSLVPATNVNVGEQEQSTNTGVQDNIARTNFGLSLNPSYQMNFSKLVQDKSMQTAFGIKVEQEISQCKQIFSSLPKANSR